MVGQRDVENHNGAPVACEETKSRRWPEQTERHPGFVSFISMREYTDFLEQRRRDDIRNAELHQGQRKAYFFGSGHVISQKRQAVSQPRCPTGLNLAFVVDGEAYGPVPERASESCMRQARDRPVESCVNITRSNLQRPSMESATVRQPQRTCRKTRGASKGLVLI